MAARANGEKAVLYFKSRDFYQRVGVINNFHELEWLGLAGHDFSGTFGSWMLPELIRFCRDNPEYHILSSNGPGRVVNQLLEGKVYYMIANGDRDPTLTLNQILDPYWPVLFEDGISSALSELDNIKNRRKV